MNRSFIILGLLAGMTGMAQTEVSNYTPGVNAEGVTYFLPQTLVEIELEAEKEVYTPGDFCNYAGKYLHLQDVSNAPHTVWTIKGMTVRTVGVRDPQKGFTVKLKDKSIASLMELSDDGVLLSINRRENDGNQEPRVEDIPAKKVVNPKDFLNEEILSATSTAKMAELVAREIYNIRESRDAILRGQADNAPKDGEALKITLANLEEQEAAFLSMFKGTVEKETKTFAIRLTPSATDVDEEVLFRFSTKLGVVDAEDLSGNPIYYSFKNLTDLPQPDESKKPKKAKRPQGIIYNIPGQALLKITRGQEVLYEEKLPVAQFGNTDVLATDLFNKGTATRVIFDPGTGAIRKIERE